MPAQRIALQLCVEVDPIFIARQAAARGLTVDDLVREVAQLAEQRAVDALGWLDGLQRGACCSMVSLEL